MPAIKAEQLVKKFKRTTALTSASFELAKGTVAALVGENGAGKSTLLHILAGLAKPTSGSVEVNGSPPTQSLGWLSRLAFTDQDASLPGSMSFAQLSQIGSDLNVVWDAELLNQRRESLNIPAERPIRHLSGGQRHSTAVLLALAKEPEVLLMDEPLAAADPVTRRGLLGILLSHAYDKNVTILLSSHLITDLERSCDHMVLLSKGRVILSKGTEEILSSHYWIANSERNRKILGTDANPKTDEVIEIDSQAVLSTPNSSLAAQLEGKPCGLEEIVIARMTRPSLGLPDEIGKGK